MSWIDVFTRRVVILFILVIKINSFGQEYKYVPMPDSNAIWSEKYYPPFDSGEPTVFHNWALFNEDIVINGTTYHKLFELDDTVLNRQKATYVGAIREDTSKRVFYLGSMRYPISFAHDSTKEVLLCDFSVNIGDTIRNRHFHFLWDYLVVDQIDTIEIFNGELRRRIKFEYLYFLEWIEGVGNNMGLIFYSDDLYTNNMKNNLICLFRENELVYHSAEYNDCFYKPTAIENNKEERDINVYPNPVKDISYINLNSKYETFEVFSVSGIKLKIEKISGLSQLEINKNKYTSGLYLYKLIDRSGNSTSGKFLVF